MRPGQSKLILVVEDNIQDEKLALRALKQGNVPAAVHVARDGKEAIDFLHGAGRLPLQPDLIFMDIHLPKYTGLEVLQKIRAHRDTAHVPVVMLTSSDQWTDVDESYRLGANGFIRKALEIDKYLEEIRIAGIYWTSINIPKRGEA